MPGSPIEGYRKRGEEGSLGGGSDRMAEGIGAKGNRDEDGAPQIGFYIRMNMCISIIYIYIFGLGNCSYLH